MKLDYYVHFCPTVHGWTYAVVYSYARRNNYFISPHTLYDLYIPGDSSEQLTPFWIASVVVLTVVVCLGTGLLVFKKIRQYKLSKGHNSDGNIFSKNIENLPYINCYLETANNPTEKFSHQNSQDLQICSSDTLLPQESVSRSTVLSNDDSDIFISTLLVDDCENCMNKWSHAVGIGTSNTD